MSQSPNHAFESFPFFYHSAHEGDEYGEADYVRAGPVLVRPLELIVGSLFKTPHMRMYAIGSTNGK